MAANEEAFRMLDGKVAKIQFTTLLGRREDAGEFKFTGREAEAIDGSRRSLFPGMIRDLKVLQAFDLVPAQF